MNNKSLPNANRLAALLHPARQKMVIHEIRQVSDTMKYISFVSAEGKELAYFEPGSYIPVYVNIDGNEIERPYALCSSPRQAEEGVYAICVKDVSGGYVSHFIYDTFKEGMRIALGSPYPAECYNPARDSKHIVALAGGSGVTPFLSMAQAIADGDIDCDLTLLYGVNYRKEIICPDKWAELAAASDGRFRFVAVVANEEIPGFEHGFITLDILRKYADINNSSFFISGPPAMAAAIRRFLEPLGIRRKFIRVSMSGDSAFNSSGKAAGMYQLTVHMAGEKYAVPAKAEETILVALERSGICPSVRCRSGKCGFCRSMIVKGDYTSAVMEDGVRKMDRQLGFIHPCCSYPASDMEIIVHRPR